jgi:hypothetical protein
MEKVMSDIGKRVETEVMARLSGLIEEEELSAMIDVALPKVRAALVAEVEKKVNELVAKKLEPFFSTYYESEQFAEAGRAIAEALVARVLKCYEEDAEAIAAGKKPVHAGYIYNPNGKDWEGSQIHNVIEKGFLRRLGAGVERHVERLLSKQAEEKADAILATILPRAAGAFMESAAMRMIREFTDTIRYGQTVTMRKSECVNCTPVKKSCAVCHTIVAVGSYCCGQYVPL